MTLRRRLLFVFFGLAVLPIAVVATLVTFGTLGFAEKRGQETLGNYMNTLSSLIDGELRTERLSLERAVSEWVNYYADVQRMSTAEWLATREPLVARLGQEPYLASRFLILEEGIGGAYRIKGHPTERGVVARGTWIGEESLPKYCDDLFSQSDGSSLQLPLPVTDLRPTGPVLTLAVPIEETEWSGRGTLIEELAVVVLLEHLLDRPVFRELGTCFALAPGRDPGVWSILNHSDASLVGLTTDAEGWGDEAAAEVIGLAAMGPNAPRPGGAAAARWDFSRSGDRLYAAGIQPTTGWLLGASLSLSPSLASIGENVRLTLLLVGVMALLVTVGIVFVTRGIGESVEEIAQSAGAIARGDLNRSIRLDRNDEFGAIANYVNQMARDLVITAESRSIARLSSRIVHDLKGVASQMNLLVHNLKENYDDPEFRAEFVHLMEELVGRVQTLSLQLRHREQEREPEWRPVDLGALVERVLESKLNSSWPGIGVRREMRPGTPVIADEELLGEVLENVITNAVEAMEGEGDLTVRTGAIPASNRASNGAPTHFRELEDSGAGMSQEFVQSELFRPFVTTKEDGIGLGMYHVRQAILRLGGKIEVTSREGAGTCVRIEVGRRKRQRGNGKNEIHSDR